MLSCEWHIPLSLKLSLTVSRNSSGHIYTNTKKMCALTQLSYYYQKPFAFFSFMPVASITFIT